MLYDGLLILALWMFIEFLVVAINGGEEMTKAQLPFVQTIVLFVIFGFFAGFWMHGGKTLGMQAWQIKLVTLDGSPLRITHCLLRFLVATVLPISLGGSWYLGINKLIELDHYSTLVAIISIVLGSIGYWWMLWDKDKLTWHDRYSMTKIISTKK